MLNPKHFYVALCGCKRYSARITRGETHCETHTDRPYTPPACHISWRMHSVKASKATQTLQGSLSLVRETIARERCSHPPRPAILSDAERGVNGQGAPIRTCAHWALARWALALAHRSSRARRGAGGHDLHELNVMSECDISGGAPTTCQAMQGAHSELEASASCTRCAPRLQSRVRACPARPHGIRHGLR